MAGLDDVLGRVQGLLFEAAGRVAEGAGIEWLERGFAAAALVGDDVDHRDTTVGLGRLHDAAAAAGLDARRAAQRVGPPG